MPGLTLEELIRASQSGDQKATEQLVEENTGLIWSVSKRFFGRGTDPDDLYQLGCVGFLKAVSGFDFSFGTMFSTYAVPKISGEIRRYLRDDGTIKVSRTLKERAVLIRTARERLTSELRREPLLSELSEALGITPEEIASAETATAAVESIQRENGDDGFTLENVLGTSDEEEKLIETIALREAIEKLSEKERLVIDLRYFRGLTQDRTARILSVSQVQISRLERRALAHLREFL